MNKPPDQDHVDEKSTVGWIFGWVWMAFAVFNVVDILRHPWDRGSAYAGSILLFVSGLVWVISLRPRLRADPDRVLIRNPLRDIEIPWGAIDEIGSHDTVRIATGSRSYHSWVGHVPNWRRSSFRNRGRSRVPDRTPGRGGAPSGAAAHTEEAARRTESDLLVQRLTGMSDRFSRGSREEGHTTESVRWSWLSIGLLAGPAVLVLVSFLVA